MLGYSVGYVFLAGILALACILFSFWLFNKLTPRIDHFQEIKENNIAVALFMAIFVIAISFLISTGVANRFEIGSWYSARPDFPEATVARRWGRSGRPVKLTNAHLIPVAANSTSQPPLTGGRRPQKSIELELLSHRHMAAATPEPTTLWRAWLRGISSRPRLLAQL